MTARIARTPQEQALLELVHPVAEAMGLEIVRLRMQGNARPTLQIMAERPDGTMIVADCARLSRAISAVFEPLDPIAGEYVLEVSSPGLDRPLTRLMDFERFAGLEAKLELDRMVEGRKRYRGILAGIEGADILIDLEGESQTAQIPFAWVFDARLVVTDALLKAKPPTPSQSEEAEGPTP